MTDSQSQRLAKAFNLRLTTLCLDAVAVNPPADAPAIDDWWEDSIDETKYLGKELPEGPDEDPVPESSIKAVYDVLASLAEEIDLSEFKRTFRRAEAPVVTQ